MGDLTSFRIFPSTFFDGLEEMKDFFPSLSLPKSSFKDSGLSVYEDEHHFYIEANAAGIPLKDIELYVERGSLYLHGEEVVEEEKKEIKYHCKSSKSFSYRIPLPENVNESETPKAEYKEGIIKITFDKRKLSNKKNIPISSA